MTTWFAVQISDEDADGGARPYVTVYEATPQDAAVAYAQRLARKGADVRVVQDGKVVWTPGGTR